MFACSVFAVVIGISYSESILSHFIVTLLHLKSSLYFRKERTVSIVSIIIIQDHFSSSFTSDKVTLLYVNLKYDQFIW